MKMETDEPTLEQLRHISKQLEEWKRSQHGWKRMMREMALGAARGVGFSIGFTVLGALLLYILQSIALANLPIIGRFLAELVRIVESNL